MSHIHDIDIAILSRGIRSFSLHLPLSVIVSPRKNRDFVSFLLLRSRIPHERITVAALYCSRYLTSLSQSPLLSRPVAVRLRETTLQLLPRRSFIIFRTTPFIPSHLRESRLHTPSLSPLTPRFYSDDSSLSWYRSADFQIFDRISIASRFSPLNFPATVPKGYVRGCTEQFGRVRTLFGPQLSGTNH